MVSDRITLSVVSHGQAALVHALLQDCARYCGDAIEVILTLNIPEPLPFSPDEFPFTVRLIQNVSRKGFGANHNAAFRQVKTAYFAILNPDIRLTGNPFPALIRALDDPAIGIVAPLILNPAGKVEDSARKFPAPMFLFRKLLGATSPPNFVVPATPVQVDWLAGMFLVVTSEIFRTAGGFDEGYFLYYEDVDLCWRLQSLRRAALQVPPVSAVHDARRESHRNARYLLWHVSSMLRFFRKRWCAALRQ